MAAKLVLNALTTRDSGRAAAITAVAEPSAGTTSESKVSKFSGLVMSTTTLPARLVAALCEHVLDGGVGHGEHDDVAGDRLVGVGGVEQLDGVAALAGDAGDGLSHVAGADDADVCHGLLLKVSCSYN